MGNLDTISRGWELLNFDIFESAYSLYFRDEKGHSFSSLEERDEDETLLDNVIEFFVYHHCDCYYGGMQLMTIGIILSTLNFCIGSLQFDI